MLDRKNPAYALDRMHKSLCVRHGNNRLPGKKILLNRVCFAFGLVKAAPLSYWVTIVAVTCCESDVSSKYTHAAV